MELRCSNKLHGIVDGDVIEVACDSRFCGKLPGVVIRHRFNMVTGELIETRRFGDPVKARTRDGANEGESREGVEQPRLREQENGARSSVSIRPS